MSCAIESDKLSEVIFQAPFTAILAGGSQSGKTTLLLKILKQASVIICPPPARIVYCFSQPVDLIKKISNIELHQGLPDTSIFDSKVNNLLILDDLISECEQSKQIVNLFCVDAHHKNISCFMLSQNLFSRGKYARTISLNANYLIIFKNPRDRSQISFLARQMYPKNPLFLIDAYDDATNQNYGYLLIDLHQKTNENFRIQSDIFSQRAIYQPK